jgi:putative flippase GtrA
MKLTLTYSLLAAIATVINIAAQELSINLYSGPWAVGVAIFFGTGVGLVVKYVLDKKYIFNFRAQNKAHDGKTFILYTLMGVVTTAIFWGFEFGFDAIFNDKQWRYLGGIIGLAIGYYAKYQLDKRFVFNVDNCGVVASAAPNTSAK